MLIVNAEIYGSGVPVLQDVRVLGDRIEQIGALTALPDEEVLDAAGGALLPGLHDHHIHLLSYAASLGSVRCGPPDVHNEAELIEAMRNQTGSGWLRGYGYHESVSGDIDRTWLDRQLPERPVRMQHRSGRLWILNSAALALLQDASEAADLPDDGRLYDADTSLGALVGRTLPPVGEASQLLASFGVTGITDMTPTNDSETLALYANLQTTGTLLQHTHIAGAPNLPYPSSQGRITTAATKIHLHDSDLPEFTTLCTVIHNSHANGRPIAVHCVTEVELVFALAAIEAAGTLAGDRIEHASVAPPHLLDTLAKHNLTVVTQPNFIYERGDAYLEDLPAGERGGLYRARGFLNSNIPLAGGTDAPFGSADPWVAIRSAVERKTASGQPLGQAEALTPEEALELFLGSADSPAMSRQTAVGAIADFCLLEQPWAQARTVLSSALVRAVFIAGHHIYGPDMK